MKSTPVKSNILLAFFLCVCIIPITAHAIAFSTPIPIFDNAKLVEKEGPDSGPWTDIEVQGFPKKISVLKKSTAKLVKCTELQSSVSVQNLNTSLKSEGWQTIEQVVSLEPIACATVDYGKSVIEIYYSKVTAKSKKEFQQKISGYKLLQIYVKDRNLKVIDSISRLSIEGNFDGIRSYIVKLIADLDNDDEHELIMQDSGYEGGSTYYFKLENGKLKQLDIDSGGI